MILNALNGRELPIYGSGDQIRDWLFVDDHVDALILAALEGKPGETYNIGGNEERSNIEVVTKICFLMQDLKPLQNQGNKNYLDLITHVSDRPGHDIRYAINPNKIINELNWKPRTNFDVGLRKTVRWYLSNVDWCKKTLTNSYNFERLGSNYGVGS